MRKNINITFQKKNTVQDTHIPNNELHIEIQVPDKISIHHTLYIKLLLQTRNLENNSRIKPKKILKHNSRTCRKHMTAAFPVSLETVVHHKLQTKHSQGQLLKRATNTASTEAFSQWILTRCSLHKKMPMGGSHCQDKTLKVLDQKHDQ